VRRWKLVVTIAIAVAISIATVVALASVPVRQHFALYDTLVSDAETGCTGILTFPGTGVSFHWSSPSKVSFGAWSCSKNSIVYMAVGTNGSGYFVSVGGVYEFGATCAEGPSCVTANVSGTYSGPLLAL